MIEPIAKEHKARGPANAREPAAARVSASIPYQRNHQHRYRLKHDNPIHLVAIVITPTILRTLDHHLPSNISQPLVVLVRRQKTTIVRDGMIGRNVSTKPARRREYPWNSWTLGVGLDKIAK
jgi:hypothetical protein